MTDDLAGKQRHLAAVVDRDRRRLTRFVQGRLAANHGGDAEDIVSDVVLRLLERADLLGQVEDVAAYLYRALAHAATDFFRRRRSHPEASLPTTDDDRQEEAISDPAPDPEQSLAQSEQRERICRALARLTPEERAVWVAVEIEGWSFRELAELWGQPIGTLLSRKSRAAKRLRTWLAEEQDVPTTSPAP